MIDGDISMMEAEELEQIEDNNKKFLYARAVHANHMIEHHMYKMLERHAMSGRRVPIHGQWRKRNDPVRIGPVQKGSSNQPTYHADDRY